MKRSIETLLIMLGLLFGVCANLCLAQEQNPTKRNPPANSALTDQQKEEMIERVNALVENGTKDTNANQFESAIRKYEEGLRLSKELGNPDLIGACLMGLTISYQRIGENEK